jgi:uncharacterized lipoprotein NlpE involved in copper resistance
MEPEGSLPHSQLSLTVHKIMMTMMMIIIIIIMHCNNNLNGKYWAVVDPKLSAPPGDPDY